MNADRFWDELAAFSLRRPRALVLAGAVATTLAAPSAVHLYSQLHTDLRELLPGGAPAAVALDALEKRVGALGLLSVIVQGDDLKAGERFVDALAAKLKALEPALVRDLRWRVDEERAFYDAHGALYADPRDLTRLRDALRARVGRANPLFVDLDDTPPAQDDLAQVLEKLRSGVSPFDRFADGYLASEKDKTLVLTMTPEASALGFDTNQRLFLAVDRAVKELDPKSFHPSLRVGYDGEVREVIEAQEQLVQDLEVSGVLVTLAVGAAIYLYYRSLRSIPLLIGPLLTGATLTYALSRVAIGYLNPNTAFLGSIILGNGINAGIILLARYLEERRNGTAVTEALPIALRTTWLGTLAASGAAAASYASLASTSFRGFSQFAFMGGTGMLLCWAATYLLMPAWIAAFEQLRPLGRAAPRAGMAAPFARGLSRGAGAAVIVSTLLSAGAIVLAVRFGEDPIEYDFSKLGSRRGQIDGAAFWSKKLDAVMGSYGTPTVVLAETPARAEAVGAALAEAKEKQGEASAIDSVVTLQRLLPRDQSANLVLLREIFSLLDDRALRSLPADLQPVARRLRERTRLVPVTLDDLPLRLVKAFREKDGQTGRLVLVYPTLGTNAQHGRLQLGFARTLREVVQETDPTALVAGQLILSADIVESITRGGSLAAVLSFAAVGLLTLIILRSLRDAAWVLGSLCLGTLWMAGAFGALEVKLNFVNFVVLPITFGIGVDYAVNFYQRFCQAPGPHRAAQALAASGGAVALCSATTILGYSALLIADSRAIHSFGLTAVIGEITCLSAALFALPAILTWRERD